MTDNIRFFDKALDELAQLVAPKLQNFQTTLDQTSTDIKNLEKWLQGCAISFYTSVPVDSDSYIAWSKTCGDWRLVYESSPDSERDYGPDDMDRESQPLIETPVHIRLKARPHLAALVAAIAKQLPVTDTEPEKKRVGIPRQRVGAAPKPSDPEDLEAIFSSEDGNPF